MESLYVVHFDGLCEPRNPGGTACYGYLIERDGQIVNDGCGVIGTGIGMTNNVAEYTALIEALKVLSAQMPRPLRVEVLGDSQLVIRQTSGEWQVKSASIRELYYQAEELADLFEEVSFRWIPRESNERADRLSRKAYSERAHFVENRNAAQTVARK